MNLLSCSFRAARIALRGLSVLSVAALASVAFAQPADVPANNGSNGGEPKNKGHLHGSAAIAALGEHLPVVAKEHGVDPQALVTLLQTQPSLGVGQDNGLLFVCKGLELSEAELAELAPESTTSWEATLDSTSATDVFKLHSLPGVTRVIYLDFDGHTTSGTSWNTNYTNGAPIISAPFSLDGDPTTFSAAERDFIRRVWQRVAEDFAPFKVDVTTEDPGVAGLSKSDANDQAYGKRVVISPTNWYGSGGGIASVGSFTRTYDHPCFVFTANLGNGEKTIAECSSHEAGHTVGLYHDGLGGSAPTEYYSGQGKWAPIMGNSYSKAVSQWSRGEYASSNNAQDDLAVIASYLPLVADDHGNSFVTATVLMGPSVATGGTIETRTDVDVFRLDAGDGTIVLNIAGPTAQPNVDLKVELISSTGEVLQVSDSETALNAAINMAVPAGTYYLRIDSVGLGDPVTTGYSDYASIGNYVITGSFPTSGAKQAPVAVLTASATSGTAPLTVNFSGQNSSDADGTIASYSWTFASGASATGVSSAYTYSTAGTYVAALTVVDNDGLSSTASATISVAAPANVPPVAVASANTTAGTAPVPITFSGSGSTDPDGSIASYSWDFGDGTSGSGAAASKTYTNAGNYTARLTVTDNRGASATSSVAVSVAAGNEIEVDVASIAFSSVAAKGGTVVSAVLQVLDKGRVAVPNVTVTVQWSGVVSGTSSGKTDGSGRVILAAPKSKKSGALSATITTVTPPAGYKYNPALFPVSSAATPVN